MNYGELPSEKEIRKMKFPPKDKWKIVAIILIIVCACAGLYFLLTKSIAPYYKYQGAEDVLITQTNTQEFYFYCDDALSKANFNLNNICNEIKSANEVQS